MSHDPLVTVVIPTCEHAHLLPDTVRSVLAQEYSTLEVVIVDDGSIDATAGVVQELTADRRVRSVRQERSGPSAARNCGLALARGELVAFLDDDDLWPRDKLRWQVEAIRDHPQAVLVYGRRALLHPDGQVSDGERGCPSGRVHDELLSRNWIDSPGQTLIRVDEARAVDGFDPRLWGSDDWDFYIRLSRRGEFLYRDRPALIYRLHEANASGNAVRHAWNHLRVARRHLGRAPRRWLRHQGLAAAYFVPQLNRQWAIARSQRRFGTALRAQVTALLFRPSLLRQVAWWRSAVASVLRIGSRDSSRIGESSEPLGLRKLYRSFLQASGWEAGAKRTGIEPKPRSRA